MNFILLFCSIFVLSLSKITSKNVYNDYIADEPNLDSYFITYINDTKIITPLKKLR